MRDIETVLFLSTKNNPTCWWFICLYINKYTFHYYLVFISSLPLSTSSSCIFFSLPTCDFTMSFFSSHSCNLMLSPCSSALNSLPWQTYLISSYKVFFFLTLQTLQKAVLNLKIRLFSNLQFSLWKFHKGAHCKDFVVTNYVILYSLRKNKKFIIMSCFLSKLIPLNQNVF